jgi:hypothetical protein
MDFLFVEQELQFVVAVGLFLIPCQPMLWEIEQRWLGY